MIPYSFSHHTKAILGAANLYVKVNGSYDSREDRANECRPAFEVFHPRASTMIIIPRRHNATGLESIKIF